MVDRLAWLASCVAVVTGGLVAHAGGSTGTRITVWGAAPSSAAFGGMTYGGAVPTSGAMITEAREVEIGATGEIRITGIAATADPASIQLRDLTEPALAITEQRFVPGATTPTELLARRIGEQVTVMTTKGEVGGVLRAVDDQTLVVETGAGDARRLSVLSVMRRDGYVLDVRVTSAGTDRPTMIWRVVAKKPGKHTVELTYRAEGISWTADYLAVLDEAGTTLDFSAWATLKNATGATFERAELTLVSAGNLAAPVAGTLRPPPVPLRFTTPTPVKIAAGDAIQVELIPARTAAKVRRVVTYEAMPDPSLNHQEDPATDCSFHNGAGTDTGRAEIAVELDLPAQTTLPEGRIRLFHRTKAGRLEVASEDVLRSSAGIARIKLAPGGEIIGTRKAQTCRLDERTRTLHEKLEVRIENKSKHPADVVIREFAWRWPVWKLDGEDKRSVRTGPQALEYRVRVPARGSQVVTYSVVYSW